MSNKIAPEFCGTCAIGLTYIGSLLHALYFPLAFLSVLTGAFLGITGIINWWRGN